MPFCSQYGNRYILEIEKFCPQCGINLNNIHNSTNVEPTRVTDNAGDIIGTGFTGSGNFMGKEIRYTVEGNVININVMEDALNDDIDKLKEIISTSTQPELLLDKTVKTDEDFEVKIENSINTNKLLCCMIPYF